MAIDIKRSFYGWTDTQPLAMGATVSVEGQGLVAVLEDNVEKVKPYASGSATFVGFARFRQLQFAIGAAVETAVIPATAPFTVELAKNNLVTGQYLVTGATPTSVDEANGVFTFDGADAGKAISIGYRWNKTVAEAKMTDYEAPVNMPDPNLAGMVGVGKGKSRIYTLHYDASKAFVAGADLRLGAGGIVTVGGTGPAIPNARVVQVPSATDPYLGIEFMA
jgi:hypothetical protein